MSKLKARSHLSVVQRNKASF